jgi:hypothetical protein
VLKEPVHHGTEVPCAHPCRMHCATFRHEGMFMVGLPAELSRLSTEPPENRMRREIEDLSTPRPAYLMPAPSRQATQSAPSGSDLASAGPPATAEDAKDQEPQQLLSHLSPQPRSRQTPSGTTPLAITTHRSRAGGVWGEGWAVAADLVDLPLKGVDLILQGPHHRGGYHGRLIRPCTRTRGATAAQGQKGAGHREDNQVHRRVPRFSGNKAGRRRFYVTVM